MTITTPDIRPCRSGLHEYDHVRYRQCPDCWREYFQKYRRSTKGKERMRNYGQSLRHIVPRINRMARQRGYSVITTPLDEILPRPDLCQCCGRQCSTGHRLCLDHCHKTGEVRAWLCHGCNGGHLGKLTHEQARLLVRIMYEGYRPAWTGPAIPQAHAGHPMGVRPSGSREYNPTDGS